MNKNKKVKCLICEKEFTGNGLHLHYWRKHTIEGQNSKPFKGKTPWNKGLKKENNIILMKQSIQIRNTFKTKNIKRGCFAKSFYGTKKHKEACAKGGGYKKRAGCGKGGYVFDSYGKKTYLQSSYELEYEKLLKDKKIIWKRPKFFYYELNDKKRKYYPDFYLVKFNIYIDTKNDYLIKMDEEKIKKVLEQNNINLIIVTKEMIDKKDIGIMN